MNENKLSTIHLDKQDLGSPTSTYLIYKHEQSVRIGNHHSSNGLLSAVKLFFGKPCMTTLGEIYEQETNQASLCTSSSHRSPMGYALDSSTTLGKNTQPSKCW